MIYYVEDDANIRDLTMYALKQADFDVVGFADADEFSRGCSRGLPDAVLLDIMLPGKSGLEILGELKSSAATRHIPVMMLSAKGAEIDKVHGLDAGADDYLAKPYGMMELVSRVRALLRRAQSPAISLGGIVRCGPIELNADARRVLVGNREVPLTLKEFELLEALMNNRGHVLTRDQLLESVWGWDFAGNTRTVDVHVRTLRQKLSQAAEDAGALIETVRGIGYTIRG